MLELDLKKKYKLGLKNLGISNLKYVQSCTRNCGLETL